LFILTCRWCCGTWCLLGKFCKDYWTYLRRWRWCRSSLLFYYYAYHELYLVLLLTLYVMVDLWYYYLYGFWKHIYGLLFSELPSRVPVWADGFWSVILLLSSTWDDGWCLLLSLSMNSCYLTLLCLEHVEMWQRVL